ncbi:hypothetical protein AMS68_006699 [Peltaster fructicola]|uniref:Uncharacterized protein n=1 Tax=Peltaster fructicola TaxID=286661 RepID=A0A6H0Y2D9_9PEZI|nr:hypothetical protein AMS68_006699 [Peltaster fructicola]
MPQHKRGPWSSQEDQLLLTLVNLHGAHNWVRISTTIGTRSPKQCRERFHQNLKPNLNHDPITPEEGLLIEQMVAEMGKRWAEIARRLRGRSDNAVKNWWNGSMNRRRRSHHQRRQEFSVRQPAQAMVPQVQQPLPGAFPTHPMMAQQLHPQYYSQALYQQQHQQRGQFPQPISLPSNAPPFGRPLLMDTPLPSPSSFSQLSAEGAPSLVSDTSSSSARSPNNGSPIELPPLSSAKDDRRNAPMLQLGASATFTNEPDYSMMTMNDAQKQMLAEHYPRSLGPAFAQRAPTYSNIAPRQQPMMQVMAVPQHYLAASFVPPPPAQVLKSQQAPTSPALQLPSISDLASQERPAKSPGLMIDPNLVAHGTPLTTASSLDESPKDKMKLSNITL